ncbi:Nif3-like dinuclear metal center hexameric protein [bacterium]|nr:Nif3-like dinuclear metal center hexameric protein [bacterium]
MNKYELVSIIENFAPLELQEKWDCSGWLVETENSEINKIMIALTVTDNVFNQAIEKHCDMIVSHHPLFNVPLKFSGVDIYCAHTNMDKALGGTTDTFVEAIGLNAHPVGEFLRICDTEISVKDLASKIKKISPNARLVNNKNIQKVSKIAFCAGSGMDMYKEALENGCDCFITGDLKYHNAVETEIVVFDAGHFETEILIKKVFQNLMKGNAEVFIANENSPFKNI